ncbi:hypothetical protein Tco_0155532 [Tanacetum coccineum]
MEEEVPDTFRLLHTLLEDFSKEDLTNACFSSGFHWAFSSLFGEDVEYFALRLFFNMDKLEKQLNAEEFNEEIAMVVCKAIAERGLYKRAHDNRVHERMMQTHKGMISKDAPEIDNNVVRASHDKDNTTEMCMTLRKILNDAEESQVKMKEKQFHFNYENMNSLYDMFVPQTKLSFEQEIFSDPSTSNVSSELSLDELDVPPKEMPNEGKLLKLFVNLENVIKKLVTFNLDFHMDKHINVDRKGIQRLFSHEVVPISRSLNECSTIIQQEITEEVKEVLDIFESMESNVDRTSKKNEILQNKMDQLLETNIANNVRNLVMQSYVEIKNKEEIERFSKESKDGDKFCNDVVEVKEKLSKQIVQLENDFAKLEAQSIAFEIALQHKTQENKSLKTLQKENENFMASLQIKNAHLKQTYKDLFQSVQSSRVETIQCDEVKIKFDFDKIETQNIELEHQVASLLKENEHLKLTYQNLFDSIKKSRVQTKTLNVTQNEAENLKYQLFEFEKTKFNNILGKIELFKKNNFDSFSSLNVNCNSSELETESGEKRNLFENKICVLQTKIDELENVLAQQTKDFENAKIELFEKESGEKNNLFESKTCVFQIKIVSQPEIFRTLNNYFTL